MAVQDLSGRRHVPCFISSIANSINRCPTFYQTAHFPPNAQHTTVLDNSARQGAPERLRSLLWPANCTVAGRKPTLIL